MAGLGDGWKWFPRSSNTTRLGLEVRGVCILATRDAKDGSVEGAKLGPGSELAYGPWVVVWEWRLGPPPSSSYRCGGK
jgi:hypothetical protein